MEDVGMALAKIKTKDYAIYGINYEKDRKDPVFKIRLRRTSKLLVLKPSVGFMNEKF